MKRYGCIGKTLAHSFSKEIHNELADYEYELIELGEDELQPFFQKKEFSALNVTIPYKTAVIPYLDSVSEIARRIGAVNTVVNRDGKLYGYNTDCYGMMELIERVGISVRGKKVLILGTGGTSKTASVVAKDLGAAEILTVSRKSQVGSITYEQASKIHSDANIIINTTPAGMYPDCDGTPIDIGAFDKLEGVIDAIYNPLRTNLVLDAKKRNINAEGGLYMLMMQAVGAVQKFLDVNIQKALPMRYLTKFFSQRKILFLQECPEAEKAPLADFSIRAASNL